MNRLKIKKTHDIYSPIICSESLRDITIKNIVKELIKRLLRKSSH